MPCFADLLYATPQSKKNWKDLQTTTNTMQRQCKKSSDDGEKGMKKWKQATLIAIFLALLTSCTTVDKMPMERLTPEPPTLLNSDGGSAVKLIDKTTIVFMQLETWKQIVRYINETRPPLSTDMAATPIKDAIISKQVFLQKYFQEEE